MAIGAIHLAWLRRLKAKNAFGDLRSVIDLGPQDIQLEQAILNGALRGLVEQEKVDRVLNSIYLNGRIDSNAQAGFYSLFGLDQYESIDVDDTRATYRVDLNRPDIQLSEYDVVTNFGTTEHVFNIGEAFKTVHNLTKPGGLSLHCVPCFAFINHGFYNIHPNLFVEMVRANKYEFVDFSYFDNAFVRNVRLGREGVESFDLDSLPVQMRDMERTQFFMNKVVAQFYRNLLSDETRREIGALSPASKKAWTKEYPTEKFDICYVFDLIFFAMRRPRERMPFIMPIQNPSGVAPLDGQVWSSAEVASTADMSAARNRWKSMARGLVRRLRRKFVR